MNWLFSFALSFVIGIGFYGSFTSTSFWVTFPLLYILLVIISLKYVSWSFLTKADWIVGIMSGVILYGLFASGNAFMQWLHIPIEPYVRHLYSSISPSVWWQHLLMFLLIIPGEELFWRGYLHKRLFTLSPFQRTIVAASFYTAAHLCSLNPLLALAAFVGGIMWGALFEWRQKIEVAMVAHVVFDVLLVYLFPLS
ncbi:CPBP family intramembrane glutamic endopeptidase [Priestia koreensis]|uniref:CPBP family intramembrane glutamic endopeptidase n=1 Tax=Priestia koreensis TaxID=284581 RepID=UPI0006A9D352|nr:type II CAAX endopeptidase family protein [Priestia koreensis]